MSTFLCGSSSLHPYECDGPGECPHCDRRLLVGHDPATCALCDPEYDHGPPRVVAVREDGSYRVEPDDDPYEPGR